MQNLKKSGFTLIELLVVIVILGILASIGFANFRGYFGKANDAERKANIRSIGTLVKSDQSSIFGINKYKYDSVGALETVLSGADFKVKVKDDFCYWYGYTLGLTNSSTDNQFLIMVKLSDAKEYGFVDGSGEQLQTVITNTTTSGKFDNLTCASTDGNTAAEGSTTLSGWVWLKLQ